MKERTFNILLAIILITFISLPLINRVFPLSSLIFPGITAIERNRHIESPVLGRKSATRYLRLFNDYYTHTFGFRNALLYFNYLLHTRLLGASPREDVIVGKNKWLYYGRDTENDFRGVKVPSVLPDYRGLAVFTPEELASIRRTIKRRYTAFSRFNRNVHLIIIVAPNKNTIYPEYLPNDFKRFGSVTRLDQIMTLEFPHGITIIDTRKSIIASKSRMNLYYKNDTHWNDAGAAIAFKELMHAICTLHHSFKPCFISNDHFITDERVQYGDLEVLLGMEAFKNYYNDIEIRLSPEFPHTVPVKNRHPKEFLNLRIDHNHVPQMHEYDSSDKSLPRMVMFYDSFGGYLIKFLADNFSHSLYLWTHDVDENIPALECEKPDIVIHEISERFLDVLRRGD